MNVLVVPDKFKGSLSASEVCQSVSAGVKHVYPDAKITQLPMADGGEGSLEVLMDTLELEYREVLVRDPLFRTKTAGYGRKGKVAYIEMARSSGLQLLSPEERSALKTSTIGVGDLLFDALKEGAEQIYLFVGGSATNDGGAGMLQGLGFRLLDESGNDLSGTGENLARIDKIIPPGEMPVFELVIVTDVQNKLLGPQGASHHYGAQKGASVADIEELEEGLAHFSSLVSSFAGFDVSEVAGSGAAGGTGVSGMGFLGARIQMGITTFLEITHFKQLLKNADLVITGEGKLDSQTLQGKVVDGVARAAHESNQQTIVVCGISEIELESLEPMGVVAILPIKSPERSMAYCMEHAAELIQQCTAEFLKS